MIKNTKNLQLLGTKGPAPKADIIQSIYITTIKFMNAMIHSNQKLCPPALSKTSPKIKYPMSYIEEIMRRKLLNPQLEYKILWLRLVSLIL